MQTQDTEVEGRKVPLTIYLVKPKMAAILEEKIKQGRNVQPLAKPLDGEFVVFPPTAREPAWVDVIRSVLDTPAELGVLNGQSPAGLLIVRRDSDTFAITFGHAWQKLEDEWLEADFGLRVALNSVPPDKIIEIRAEQVFANWHIASERAPRASFVHQFGVEFDRDVMASLTGVPSNENLFGSHVRGGTNVHLETSFSRLGDVLDKAGTLFRSNGYKKRWPEVGNVAPVNDLALITALDAILDADFKSGDAQKKLVLFTPAHRHGEEFKLANSYVYGRLTKHAVTRPYMFVESWLNFLKEKEATPSTSEAKENCIHLLDEGKEEIKNYRIYDCFGYETSLNKRPFILSSGVWYEVVPDFMARVNSYLASNVKAPPKLSLPKWNGVDNEGEYNTRCGAQQSFLHFDCKNIMFGGGHSRFEFCDFLDTKTQTLCFAKMASKSSGMSHLVEQVRRTAELLFDPDQAYRDKLIEVYKAQHPNADRKWLTSRPKNADWNLCLVSLNRTAKALPFFAKCSLWKLHRDLTARGHEVFFAAV